MRSKLRNLWEFDPSPEVLVRFHMIMMVLWGTIGMVVTFSLPASILWIGFMSAYALFVGHFASYDGARAERSMESRLDRLEERLDTIHEICDRRDKQGWR